MSIHERKPAFPICNEKTTWAQDIKSEYDKDASLSAQTVAEIPVLHKSNPTSSFPPAPRILWGPQVEDLEY